MKLLTCLFILSAFNSYRYFASGSSSFASSHRPTSNEYTYLAPESSSFTSSRRPICNKYCDYIAASELPNSEEFYSFEYFGRTVTLHMQREGGMMFGRLSSGEEGDKIWLERLIKSRKHGAVEKIGAVTLRKGSIEATTPGINVDGNLIPVGKFEIGTVRVCAKAHDHDQQKCSNLRGVPICMIVCDNVDRRRLTNETRLLVGNVLGRQIEVIASFNEHVIYAHLSHGQPEDEIWLERCLKQGEDCLREDGLGLVTVPANSNETFTPAFNVNYKTGVAIFGHIRVCLRADGIHCTKWLQPPICNMFCDGDEYGKALGVKFKSRKEGIGRRIRVVTSVNVTDDVACVRIRAGDNRDVWLERSWDGGKSWEGPLGLMNTSSYRFYTYSKVFNYNRRKPILQAGQIRACARSHILHNTICTEWTSATTTTTEEPSSEVVEDYPEDSRMVTFEDCALAIIDHMKQTEDRLYYRFARISEDEAVTKFKKLFCKNYRWQDGNCNRCFREVFMQ